MSHFTEAQYIRWENMLASAANQQSIAFDSDSESLPDPELEVEIEVFLFICIQYSSFKSNVFRLCVLSVEHQL